jgi:hypothetical protein
MKKIDGVGFSGMVMDGNTTAKRKRQQGALWRLKRVIARQQGITFSQQKELSALEDALRYGV